MKRRFHKFWISLKLGKNDSKKHLFYFTLSNIVEHKNKNNFESVFRNKAAD